MSINTMMGKYVTATRNASGNVTGLSTGGKRVGGVTLVSYANSSGFVALPESAEQIFSDVVLIPANTVKPGDKFQFVCFSEDAGTASAAARAVRAKVHTDPNVLSGALLCNIQIGTATNTKIHVDKVTVVTSTGEVRSTSTASVGGLMSTTAQVTTSIDWTVDQYIGLCVINSNTLVNFLVYHASVVLEAAQ